MQIALILMFNFFNFTQDNYKQPEHIKVADEIQAEVGDRVSKLHRLKIVGDYGALFDKINELGFRFQVVGPKTKDQLREILVDCTEDLVATVNRTEGIEKYLGSCPFTYKNVDIGLFLVDEQGYEIHYPLYGLAGLTSGKLEYMTDEEGHRSFKTIETENYEDALKIVKGK